MPSTLVCVPTYREAENIEAFLRRLRPAVPEADVLVVDDGSPDGTADLAEQLAGELGQIEVLRRPGKMGLGSAYRAAFTVGLERGYDVLVEIDADLSHEPEALPTLLARIDEGADLAIGSRYVAGGSTPYWPRHRRALSILGCRYAAFCLGLSVRDVTAGFRAYRADMLKTIDVASTESQGYSFQIENTHRVARAHGRIVEEPIRFTDRAAGSTKMSWAIVAEAMVLVTWWGLQDRRRRGRQRPRSSRP
jgi:dolichol-phosphate mannosyltransferase